MITAPPGFTVTTIAHVDRARELAVAPNGDLFVGTSGDAVYVIHDPNGEHPDAPKVFVRIEDAPVAGVTFGDGALFAGGQFGVYRIDYTDGDLRARGAPQKIASVRTSGKSSDHHTTSVAFSRGTLYASVGSSCNACDPELDATRASIQQMGPHGENMSPKAVHVRNAIALVTNENTGTVWAGVAGQDELAPGHPYEMFDPVTLHSGTADYGWPHCYENQRPVSPGSDCSRAIVSRVVFPAYITPIGDAFYPADSKGTHPFPREYWGGAFVAFHGSWHQPLRPPRVAFVPMHGDDPATPVNWNDPAAQWREFLTGYQNADGSRVARATGVAVGADGDLFVADDDAGTIVRVRYGR